MGTPEAYTPGKRAGLITGLVLVSLLVAFVGLCAFRLCRSKKGEPLTSGFDFTYLGMPSVANTPRGDASPRGTTGGAAGAPRASGREVPARTSAANEVSEDAPSTDAVYAVAKPWQAPPASQPPSSPLATASQARVLPESPKGSSSRPSSTTPTPEELTRSDRERSFAAQSEVAKPDRDRSFAKSDRARGNADNEISEFLSKVPVVQIERV